MAAAVSAEVMDRLRTFDRNLRWAKENPSELSRYEGEYVVVDRQAVIFSSPKKKEAQKQVAGRPGSYVIFVPPKGLAWVL
jgi:hypothetical protein